MERHGITKFHRIKNTFDLHGLLRIWTGTSPKSVVRLIQNVTKAHKKVNFLCIQESIYPINFAQNIKIAHFCAKLMWVRIEGQQFSPSSTMGYLDEGEYWKSFDWKTKVIESF